jgi:hypothetical protein
VADAYRSALFRIDWMVLLEIMPAMVGFAASASLLMRLGGREWRGREWLWIW